MDMETIGIAGLGLLGRGIAACLLGHGLRVIGFTQRRETHAEARSYIDQAIGELIERAGFPRLLKETGSERYTEVDSCRTFAECDFVIESVVEDMAAKQRVFDEIEAVVRPDVAIASNTSALPITHLQRGRVHPERFLGMHWSEPAHATRFLELIRGEETCDAAFDAALTLGRLVGKEPSLVLKDVPAFIANRMGYAIYREALYMLQLGVGDLETIDRSFRNAVGLWATFCGPFRWIDLTGGPALYGRCMQGVLPSLSNATDVSQEMKDLMEAEARGIANGRGFYDYTEAEAERWTALFTQHAWTVRELMNKYSPLRESSR
jgi:3-hydroxybutyryl-CoA dehydrogenase